MIWMNTDMQLQKYFNRLASQKVTWQDLSPNVHFEMHLQKSEFFSFGLLMQSWGFHPAGGGRLLFNELAPTVFWLQPAWHSLNWLIRMEKRNIICLHIGVPDKLDRQMCILRCRCKKVNSSVWDLWCSLGASNHLEEGRFLAPPRPLRMKSRNC